LLAELKKEKTDQENREKEIIDYWREELFNLKEDNNQLYNNYVSELQQ